MRQDSRRHRRRPQKWDEENANEQGEEMAEVLKLLKEFAFYLGQLCSKYFIKFLLKQPDTSDCLRV